MRRLLGIIIFSLLFSGSAYTEEINYEWFKTQTKHKSANGLILEDRFKNFLKENIPSTNVYLGMNKGKEKVPLLESYLQVLGGPPNEIIYKNDKRYIFTSACRHQSCPEKGVLFVDTEKEHIIGLIRHSFFNDTKFTSDEDFLIFSKNHKSFHEIPLIFIEMVKDWIVSELKIKLPSKVRFIGSENKIIDVPVYKFMTGDIQLAECEGTDFKKHKNCKGFSENENFTDYVIKKYGEKYGENIWTRNYFGAFGDDPGKYEGKGAFIWYRDGKSYATYLGSFLDSESHGKGNIIWQSGNRYSGQFEKGYLQGTGTLKWKKGGQYSGQFKKNLFHGKGQEIWTNGDKYIGEYKDGAKHGEGIQIFADGTQYKVNYTNGQLNDPKLKLECRMLDGDLKTDIFFVRDLNQSSLFKILEYTEKEIRYTYTTVSTITADDIYIFNRDTKILTSPGVDDKGNLKILKAKCNDTGTSERVILESNKDLAWKIKEKYLKPECLYENDLYVGMSFDKYEEYYTKYLGKETADPFTDKEFINFYKNIGLYIGKEIPLNHKFKPSWSSSSFQPDDTLTLSLDLSDCIEKNSTSKVYFDQSKFFISELKDVKPEDIKVLAPHINQEFISIKRFTINENTIDGFEDLYSSIYGILEIEGKLFMVPLKNGS